jgi:hypothetical protein
MSIMKYSMGLFLLLFSLAAQAADDSTVILDSENYDQKMCIDRTSGDCVNTICLTSEERDCTDKCKADAEEKCKAIADGDM